MKKKCIFPLALAAIMLLPLLTSAAGFLNRISYTVNYDYSNLTVGTDTLGGVTYATVGYEGLYNGGAPGTPSLPIDYIRFSVPYNATNFTVTATRIRPSNRNLDYLVYPCQMPRLTDGSQAPPVTLPDTAAYFSGNPYPTQVAWIADEGFLAGENHIVTVAVMPLRYTHSASSDVLSGARICNLVLSYDLSDSLAMYPIVRNDSLLREEGYQLTQSMVVNPGQVKGFAPAYTFSPGIDTTGFIQGGIGGDIINGGGYAGGDGPTPLDSIPNNGVDTTGLGTGQLLVDVEYPYLIVTTPELMHAVRRIAALKRQKGYNVKVVTIDEVMHDSIASRGDYVNGHIVETDSAAVLRQYLRQCYSKEGTQFVLLAGDLPYRKFNRPEDTVLSDLYFSDLSANWADMFTDRFPELFVGRIPANHIGSNHVDQIHNYTEKLFRYELNPGKGDYSYLERAFFSEGREFSGYLDDVKESLNTIYQNPVIINDYKGNNSNHPTGKDVVDALISNPVGFISIYNHGDTTKTRVYGYDCDSNIYFIHAIKPIMKGDGLNCLQNKYYPMIYYSPSCVTMPFDNKNKLSFGESFTMGKDYGGPVYIGYTRAVYRDQGKLMAKAFANEIKNGYVKLGIAAAMSKYEYGLNTFDASFILGCFGDPEVELWTGIPQVYSDINIIRTDNSFIISGLPSEATIVAYLNKHFLVKTQNVTDSSITINDVLPNSPIMIYQHNHIPYIAPLILQDSQYIISNDLTAGNSIDSSRIRGDVVVKNGAIYEVEASGIVRLEDGFKVEKGATFAVYPSCF